MELNKIPMLVGLGFIILLIVFMIAYYLVGRLFLGRTSARSYTRLAITFGSALVAFALTKGIYFLFGNVFNDLTYRYVPQILEMANAVNDNVNQAMSASASLQSYITSLTLALIGPIIFVLLFMAISIIAKLIALIIFWVNGNKSMKKKQRFLRRCMNACISGVCAVISFSVITLPFIGYTNYATEIYYEIEKDNLIPEDEQISEIALLTKNTTSQFPLKLHWNLSKGAFASLTTVRTRGRKNTVSFKNEVMTFENIAICVMEIMEENSGGQFNTQTIDSVEKLFDEINKSDYLTQIAAEILKEGSNCWINNQTFCGYNIKDNIPEDLYPAVDVILSDFANTDRDKLIDDLKVITNAVSEIMVVADTLQSLDTSNILNVDVQKINDAVDMIKNQKVKEVAVSVIVTACQKWKAGESFMDINIKEQIADLDSAIDVLLDEIIDTTPETVADDVKNIVSLLKPVSELNDIITTINLTDVANIDTTGLKKAINIIGDNEILRKASAAAFSKAAEKWSNGETVFNAQLLGEGGQVPKELQNTVKMIFDDIKVANESDIIEKLNNFVDFADIMGKTYANFSVINLGDYDSIDTVAFDELINEVEIHPNTKVYVASLLRDAGNYWGNGEAFFDINLKQQLSSINANYETFFDSMIERMKASTKNTVLADLKSVSSTLKTFKYTMSLSQNQVNVENMNDTMEDLVNSITPDTADTIKGIITSEVLQSTGFVESDSQAVSQLISNTIDGVQNLNPQDKVAEAEALNKLIIYSKESSNGNSQVSTDEMLQTVVQSKALSNSVKNYADNNTSAGITLEQNQKNNLKASLDNMETTASAEDKQIIDALRVLFGTN